MSRAPGEGRPSFWTTIPGMLSALAGVVSAVVAVVGLLIVGGPSDRPDGTPTSPASADRPVTEATATATSEATASGPTQGQWAQRANEVCADGARESVQLNRQLQSTHDLPRFLLHMASLIRHNADELAAIPRPVEDRANVDQVVAYYSTAASNLESGAVAVQAGDQAAYEQRRDTVFTALQEATVLLARGGATACVPFRKPELRQP
jgi:hypothetical protein